MDLCRRGYALLFAELFNLPSADMNQEAPKPSEASCSDALIHPRTSSAEGL